MNSFIDPPSRRSFSAGLRRARMATFVCLSFMAASHGTAAEISVSIIDGYPAFPAYEVGYFVDNNTATDYASLVGGTATVVDFQLPGPVNVGSVVYTDRTSSGGANGSLAGGAGDNVLSYKLFFSDSPTFSPLIYAEEFLSPGFANTDPPQLINGGLGIVAQYVRWQPTAAAGGNTGGAEIHFFEGPFAVPEPSGLALGLVGLLSVMAPGIARAVKRLL